MDLRSGRRIFHSAQITPTPSSLMRAPRERHHSVPTPSSSSALADDDLVLPRAFNGLIKATSWPLSVVELSTRKVNFDDGSQLHRETFTKLHVRQEVPVASRHVRHWKRYCLYTFIASLYLVGLLAAFILGCEAGVVPLRSKAFSMSTGQTGNTETDQDGETQPGCSTALPPNSFTWVNYPRHYAALGLPPNSEPKSIDRRCKSLFKVWHPDKTVCGLSKDEAGMIITAIVHTCTTLRDEEERAKYDKVGVHFGKEGPKGDTRVFGGEGEAFLKGLEDVWKSASKHFQRMFSFDGGLAG